MATVEGRDILRSDVVALRTTPDDLVELDSEDFRQELMSVIAQVTVEESLRAEFDVSVQEGEVAAALDARLRDSGLTMEQAVSALEDPAATEERLRQVVRSELLRERAALALSTSDEFVDDVLENRPDLVTTVCVRHVLVLTESEANDVKDRLDAGEDFAEVATEVSLDTGTPGGNLGCDVAARYVAPFADATLSAPVGELFGPVETDFGWHVLIVDERIAPSRADLLADPRSFVPAELISNEFTGWFNTALRAADIVVAEEVGTWLPEGPGILPPGG